MVEMLIFDWFTSIAKGVVDGGLVTRLSLYEWRLGELVSYATNVSPSQHALAVVMNWEKWNSLPPDIQQILDEMTGAYAADFFDTAYTRVASDENLLRLFPHLEITHLSPEELARWDERGKPRIDEYIASLEAKGLPGKAYFDELQRLLKKYESPY